MSDLSTHSVPVSSRAKSIGLWIYRIVIVLLFLPFATFHLIGWFGWREYMINEFDLVGLGQWLRYFTGILELTGVALVLVPRLSAVGALILLIVDFGAFLAEVTVLHVDWVHTVIYGLILAGFIYLQRQTLVALRR